MTTITDLIEQLEDLKQNYGNIIIGSTYNKILWDFLIEDIPPKQPDIDPIVYDLVNLLDQYRVESYQQWIRLGICLKNISPNLLPLWNQASKKSSKWDPVCCPRAWKKIQILPPGEGLGIGSLHYWAKLDNPEAYQSLFDQQVDLLDDENSVEVNLETIEGNQYITFEDHIYEYNPDLIDSSLEDLKLLGVRDGSYIHWFDK